MTRKEEQGLSKRAFLFTTGDGRPTANAFWMPDHQQIIPRVEATLERLGYDPFWLHDKDVAISSPYMARDAGNQAAPFIGEGDLLVDLTTGWNFPENFGVIAAMFQDLIRSGKVKMVLTCNMKEKAPGYVAARANALILEIMELPYAALTVIDQSDAGWAEYQRDLEMVINGEYSPNVPATIVATNGESGRIAKEALALLQRSGGVVPIINPSSMSMAQGWPHYPMFKRIGLTPIAVGSNEFQADMARVSMHQVLTAYGWLQDAGLNFVYEPGGLREEEIFEALRMYYAKLEYAERGALGMGTQGQMDMTGYGGVATDLSESLMMSSLSPGKMRPIVDVTESDCEALWTSLVMQALIQVKYDRIDPIGFHDVRHYNAARDTLVLLNSGALAFDFMTDTPGDYSGIYAVSQNREVYFLFGGACIKGNMRPVSGANMFRVHGRGTGYRMQGVKMDILPLDWAERKATYGDLDPWPMGIVQTPYGTTKGVTLNWVPNHSQHCNADIMREMASFCRLVGVGFHCYAN